MTGPLDLTSHCPDICPSQKISEERPAIVPSSISDNIAFHLPIHENPLHIVGPSYDIDSSVSPRVP